MNFYDVVVIGAGHAGCEAAWAAARMGARVAVCTLSPDTVALMPCNPAIGGTAKGHLVREIDAMGGLMGMAIDATGIQFKVLNKSRGPAVWSPRAQADKRRYGAWVKARLSAEPNVTWLFARAGRILTTSGRVSGVEFEEGGSVGCGSLVVTTGTFLNGLVHIGDERFPSGRAGEPPSTELAESIRSLGFEIGRLKTGTPPRLLDRSIDFSKCSEQLGDERIVPFSFMTRRSELDGREQIACHLLHSTEAAHELVRRQIDRSPLYNGQIQGVGPRYCPSFEDKVMRFPDRSRHQIFLEPEGLETNEVYVNGLSMSLPRAIQEEIVHSLPGLERAQFIRHAYAVEYDFVQPTELTTALETKRIPGLFMAGQINGTSGYEEAAAQGLMAGINAVRSVRGDDRVVLDRSEGYIGILIEDLVTQGCSEPYRMFTSRAEHRLSLRIDNADLRLTRIGRAAGLVDDERWSAFCDRAARFEGNLNAARTNRVRIGSEGESTTAAEALARPGVTVDDVSAAGVGFRVDAAWAFDELDAVSAEFRYGGYVKRQQVLQARLHSQSGVRIPAGLEYAGIPGLSREMVERLAVVRPETIGQLGRVLGDSRAAVSVVAVWVSNRRPH